MIRWMISLAILASLHLKNLPMIVTTTLESRWLVMIFPQILVNQVPATVNASESEKLKKSRDPVSHYRYP